jgi:HK97 family phage portal protein
MKIFGFNLSLNRSRHASAVMAQPLVQRSGSDMAEEWLRGADLDKLPSLRNAFEQVVWVYRAINVLAEQVANVPFLFSTGPRGGENLITSGPLPEFYRRPHPQINRFQYWELRVMWLMLRGECVRVPVFEEQSRLRTQSSKLKTVLILDPSRFQHIVERSKLVGWRYNGFGPDTPLASQVFLPEEVWFEKLPNPFDFWRGFPPLYVAGMAARADFAASSLMRGILENNADSGIIVRTNECVGDEQREQILTALKKRKGGAGVADRPLLLPGVAEIIRPQLSSADLQFLDNRKFSRAEICAAFGVPEEIVTSTEHAKYDVMTGARLNFIENRVAPFCSRLEAEEDATVKTIDPNASGWFDLDSLPILQDARRHRLAAARAGFDMGVPFNELNRVLDLGFKPLPWGDKGFIPTTMQPATAIPQARP